MLPIRTVQFLQTNIGFGDWLVLVMMALHLDIKLFTDILLEIENLADIQSRSRSCSISTGVDILPPSDTEESSKGCLKPHKDMLTMKVKYSCTEKLFQLSFQIDDWEEVDEMSNSFDKKEEEIDEAMEQHLLQMEQEEYDRYSEDSQIF